MTHMNDFKEIADGMMSDMNVTVSMKQRTLAACHHKRTGSLIRYLVPAACLVLIFGIMRMTGYFPKSPIVGNGNDTNINILMASPESAMENAPASSQDPAATARDILGNGFLVPSYIPEGFQSGGIEIHQEGQQKVVYLHYASDNGAFILTERKTETPSRPSGFEGVEINDGTGYLKQGSASGQESSNIELYWYINGIQYGITGSISGEDAIKAANSMKQQP